MDIDVAETQSANNLSGPIHAEHKIIPIIVSHVNPNGGSAFLLIRILVTTEENSIIFLIQISATISLVGANIAAEIEDGPVVVAIQGCLRIKFNFDVTKIIKTVIP